MRALPNVAEQALADVIRSIGRAGFESVLAQFFRRAVAHDNLVILAYRDTGPPQILFQQSDDPQVFAALQTVYRSGAYLLDPFYDLHLNRVPSGAYRMIDVAPDAFQRSRYFTDYYRQTTLVDEVGYVSYPAPGVSLNVCLGRDAVSGQQFSPRDIETCQRVAPLITAMAEAHWADLPSHAGPAGDVTLALIRAAEKLHGIRLSPRQAEVALLILRGHSSVSIGLRLGVATQTVKVFRKQLYNKCRISSQAQLFALMLPLLNGAV